MRADSRIDVSGGVSVTTDHLEVRVSLANRGDRRAGPIDVIGELGEERQQAQLPGGLEPGAEGAVTLAFASAPPQPGLHALTLLLEHPVEGPPDGAGNPPMASQRAFLLLALGASPAEAVHIEASTLRLDVRGSLLVHLTSRDGKGQRVRLRLFAARGLRPDQGPIDVVVPPQGQATVQVPIVRAGAPRGSRQAVLLVAETPDEPVARTSVAAATVEVLPDPAWLPRLRVHLLAGGIGLVLLALGYEVRARLRARGAFPA